MLGRLLRFILWSAILLGSLLAILRATAIRWWRVPEGDPFLEASIAPSLRGGDLVVLWRLTSPRFGDLVLCPEPNHPERVIIGRVVGEAGDDVTVDGDRITVNARTYSTERRCDPPSFHVVDPIVGNQVTQPCEMEALGNRLHPMGSSREGLGPRGSQIEVAEGRVFLVSDNRQFPYDSRDYGSVERVTCKESVVFRVVPREGWNDPRRFTVIR